MTDINPAPSWANVRQLETNEYATGGLNGNMNEQAKALAGQNMYSRLYAGLPFDPAFTAQVGGFPIGGKAALENGDIVRSTIANNTVDPNADMTGWENESEKARNDYFKNATTITLEQFGGKTTSEDPSFDNADIIDAMFLSYYSLYKSTTGLTSGQIQNAINATRCTIVKLNGLYRTTRPFHIPPCTAIEQPFDGYFVKNPKFGILYEPTNLNSYAVSPLLYKKNGTTYDVDTDVSTLPTGAEFDNGAYIMAGVRQQTRNLHVLTKRGVTLAYRLVGWAGNYAENIGCGENNGVSSRNPKVACLVASGWGARINGLNTLSTHQGYVTYNANGGLVVSGMYTNRAADISDYGVDDDLILPFRASGYTALGSTGIMQIGETKFNSPVCEGWAHAHVSSNRVSSDEPHFERITKSNFYLINCEADINLKGVTSIDATSLFYLKDYRDFGREVKVRGLLTMGGKLVLGENSDPSLILDVLRPHTFIQFFRFGDLNLIKSVVNKWGADTLYINAVTGDDEFTGLRDIRALKTFANVKKLASLFNIKKIQLLSDVSVSSTVDIPNETHFSGNFSLNLSASLRASDYGKFDLRFGNSSINVSNSSAIVLFNQAYNSGDMYVSANISGPSAMLFQSAQDLNINVDIKNTSTVLNQLGYCLPAYKQSVGLVVTSGTFTMPFTWGGGGGFFKYRSPNLTTATLVVTDTIIPANSTIELTVSLPTARTTDMVQASYSNIIAGLIYTANVSVSGTIKVIVSNISTSAKTLTAGTLTVKLI